MRDRLAVPIALALLALAGVAASEPADGAGAATAAAEPVIVAGPVRFVTEPDVTVALGGGTRYLGTLELAARGDGVRPIVETDLDTYLYGLAEMPPRWHEEALKAQAVAARTYAWHAIERASYDGYDICATTACQVFRGAEVVLEPEHGGRWRAAVDATSGEVLLDADGRPILARYFSTSGGRTFANEEAFPSSGPRPYLVSVDDPDDAVSPLHRWTVRFTREEFDAIAARGATLGRIVPIVGAERLGEVDDPRALVRFTGAGGRRVEVRAIALRDFLSDVGPTLFPDRFPGPRDDGSRPLPVTVPSTRYAIEVTPEEVVLSGRGWGHGVGMGQYGARGKAERGEPYDRILAAYYNGLLPVRAPDVPQAIRVGLDPIGAETTVRADGPTRIVAGDVEVIARTLGTWSVRRGDGGFVLTPPVGSGSPLEASATAVLDGDDLVAGSGRPVLVGAEVSRPVLVRLEVRDPEGAVVLERDLGLAEAGEVRATWDRVDPSGVAVPPGDYAVVLEVTDAEGSVVASPATVRVAAPPPPVVLPPSASETPGTPVAWVGGLAAVAVAALVVGRAWVRGGRRGARPLHRSRVDVGG